MLIAAYIIYVEGRIITSPLTSLCTTLAFACIEEMHPNVESARTHVEAHFNESRTQLPGVLQITARWSFLFEIHPLRQSRWVISSAPIKSASLPVYRADLSLIECKVASVRHRDCGRSNNFNLYQTALAILHGLE
ncbi:hypothetical protein VTL71DRAFT_10554, partial [Oculimacula yallundae]